MKNSNILTTNLEVSAEAANRQQAIRSLTTKTATRKAPQPVPQDPPKPKQGLGRLEMVDLDRIIVGERFRKDVPDIERLSDSIADNGLISPILLDEEFRLIAGRCRMEAVRRLGRSQIECRIINIDDPLLAEIDEDAERLSLLPSEKFAVTESLRDSLQSDAKRRQRLGIKFEAAKGKQGRVDDLLAQKVGLSRPTLQKIREIVEAARRNPDLEELVKEMDRTGKVDRIHRRYREMIQPAPVEPIGIFGSLYFRDWSDELAEWSLADIANRLRQLAVLHQLKENAVVALELTGPQVAIVVHALQAWKLEFASVLVSGKGLVLVATRGEVQDIDSILELSGEGDVLVSLEEFCGPVLEIEAGDWTSDDQESSE